jgi:hypothetical protein
MDEVKKDTTADKHLLQLNYLEVKHNGGRLLFFRLFSIDKVSPTQ